MAVPDDTSDVMLLLGSGELGMLVSQDSQLKLSDMGHGFQNPRISRSLLLLWWLIRRSGPLNYSAARRLERSSRAEMTRALQPGVVLVRGLVWAETCCELNVWR